MTLPKSDSLRQDIYAALRAWHSLEGKNLLAYLFLVQEQRKSISELNKANLRRATNDILKDAIDVLQTQNTQQAQILKLRFWDNHIVIKVGHQLGLTEDEVKKRSRKALEALTQLILDREMALRHERIQYLESGLSPKNYTHLFGLDQICQELTKKLLNANSPGVIIISGIGGIGKTTLADTIVRHVIPHFLFHEIHWLRADALPGHLHLPTILTTDSLMTTLAHHLKLLPSTSSRQREHQVRAILRASPHLIVIDNLETDIEPSLLAHLNDLSNPSRFLLTTRIQPPSQSGVFSYTLPSLSAGDVAQLIRYHAQEIGVPELAKADDQAIQNIYHIVGGNPLALKLVVSLMAILSLTQVMDDLVQAKLERVEAMYTHIYSRIWKTLSNEAQTLLKVMPLAATIGSEPEQLLAISGLSEKQLLVAISELTKKSLLEVRGTIQSRRYGIHRLTEAFLQTEIIHWPK